LTKPLLIKNGDVFTFKNYTEAFTFLQENKDKCEKGVLLGIPYDKTNEVVAYNNKRS
jgi:hypothetical protein